MAINSSKVSLPDQSKFRPGTSKVSHTRHGELFAKLSAALALFFLVLRILQLKVVAGGVEPGRS